MYACPHFFFSPLPVRLIGLPVMQPCSCPQSRWVYNIYRINFVLEVMFHRMFGEPWIMAEHNMSLVYPYGDPGQSPTPTPTPFAAQAR